MCPTSDSSPPRPTEVVDLASAQAFVDLTPADRARLARFHTNIAPHMDHLVEAFYAFLESHEPLRRILATADVPALRRSQRASLEKTLTAERNAAYLAHLEHLAVAHVRAGVSPMWFLGSYHFWQRRLHDLAFALEDDVAEAQEVCLAIDKAFCLDMGLATEAHLREYKRLHAERKPD